MTEVNTICILMREKTGHNNTFYSVNVANRHPLAFVKDSLNLSDQDFLLVRGLYACLAFRLARIYHRGSFFKGYS
jgi:hypothetical protein